jgi:mRNA-degrading endonuclease RelE of RelBE toxin-antitoxin system
MAFRITITTVAEGHLRALPAREQRLLEAAIQARLAQQPTTPTKAVKRLRPNPLAEYELRVGDLRVLYNVAGDEVILLVVGRKVGNQLIVEGEEFHAHRDDPAQPPGGEPGPDAP